jgi:adenylate cyclase class 2
MIEVEVKARVSRPDQLERIESFVRGWTALSEVMQEDLYFSHPCRDFSRTDEALRLRRVGGAPGAWYLTYKGPRLDRISKTREEVEIRTAPEIEAVLEKLGFSRVGRIVKRRRGFTKGDTLLYLDDVEGVGRFVELESASHDIDKLSALLGIIKDLGLKSERRSYLELSLAGDP